MIIPVSAGSGSIILDFGDSKKKYESLTLTSPDNTPMYDFKITGPDGSYRVGATSIDAQNTKIVEPFQLNGLCTIQISNAVDDGNYDLIIFEK